MHKDPIALVGRQIKQDEESGITTWYCGRVIDYCTSKKIHCVAYEGDDNQYHYDLAVDLLNGDLTELFSWSGEIQRNINYVHNKCAIITTYYGLLQHYWATTSLVA